MYIHYYNLMNVPVCTFSIMYHRGAVQCSFYTLNGCQPTKQWVIYITLFIIKASYIHRGNRPGTEKRRKPKYVRI